MATIVKVRGQEDRFVLLGTGFGMMKSARASRLLGDLFPVENAQEATMAALSDAEGRIHWFPSRDLEVISIDGISPADHLGGYRSDAKKLSGSPKTPEGVKQNPHYEAFLEADESHRYIYKEDLVTRFHEWLEAGHS